MPEREYLKINREAWTRSNAQFGDASAENLWNSPEITWGVWRRPESELKVLADVRGRDVIELGCGTGYFGSWLKRAGARRVVGVDLTPAQLATARRLNSQFERGMEFIESNAESVPLPDSEFDIAISEYGASIWCDPELWIPEAARLLRPGGELVFLCNSLLSMLCVPDTGPANEQLVRQQRGMKRMEWTDEDPGVEFHLGHGEMLRLLRRTGFEVIDLVEVYAGDDAVDHPIYNYISADWARKWPSEEIWRAVLRG